MTVKNPKHPASKTEQPSSNLRTAAGVPKLYTTKETAALLSLTERQVIDARQAGRLGCVRLSGAAVRHSEAQIAAFIEASSVEAVER